MIGNVVRLIFVCGVLGWSMGANGAEVSAEHLAEITANISSKGESSIEILLWPPPGFPEIAPAGEADAWLAALDEQRADFISQQNAGDLRVIEEFMLTIVATVNAAGLQSVVDHPATEAVGYWVEPDEE